MSKIESGTRLIADRYVLRSMIGRGGSGAVWSADDLHLRRRVAIKQIVVSERRSTRSRARAMREARAVARLHSPGIVQVYDVHDDGAQIFLVMELVDAPSLSRLVRRSGPLEPARAAAIGQTMLSVLATVHAAGIVHRDVKPSNVLVDGTDVHLTDFGIALFGDDPALTAAGSVLGTPAYMAPEQARGERAGPAADLYGLGATLYYAVEGRAPFADIGSWETTRAVRDSPHRPGSRLGALEPVVEALLAKDPGSRPGVADIAAALAVVGTGTVLTPPPWTPAGDGDRRDDDASGDGAAAAGASLPSPADPGSTAPPDPRSTGAPAGSERADDTAPPPAAAHVPGDRARADAPHTDHHDGWPHRRNIAVTTALLVGLVAVLVLLYLAVRGGSEAPVTMLLLPMPTGSRDLPWRRRR